MPDRVRLLTNEFGLALMLLTRLPAGFLVRQGAAGGQAVWAYPLVGAVVGGLGALTLWLGRAVGLPQALPAVWALAAMALVTGALHEDGLADTADGFGGGRGRTGKLAIMRDSRIGTFGVLALLLSLSVRGGAMASVPVGAVVASAVVGRAAIVLVLLLLPAARPDGLGAGLGGVPASRGLVALILAALAVLLLVPFATALSTLAAAAMAAIAVAWVAWRQIGGYTGDVCGAAEQGAECLALTVMAAGLGR